MMKVFTDRSRIETFQRCNRLRFLEYHEGAEHMGITSKRKPLPLAVGGAVHAGLAVLLQCTMGIPLDELSFELAELKAVQAALEDFSQFQAALDIGEEANEMRKAIEQAKDDPELKAAFEEQFRKGQTAFDQYLYQEQAALVEGLVRAYTRRRLRPLLEQYEVLEVEREGSWKLSEWKTQEGFIQRGCQTCGWHGVAFEPTEDNYRNAGACPKCNHQTAYYGAEEAWELMFMSRPDALLLERQSRQLYILSFKTAAKWDRRKDEDAKRDMQGLSEGVEVEKRLATWWHRVQFQENNPPDDPIPQAMVNFLATQSAAPRILGIRYEYMLKGDRLTDRDLTEKLGVDVRSQRSPLVRAYRNAGMTAADTMWNVSWEYVKETGEPSKLYYKNWHGAPVWEERTVKEWIDLLDSAVMAVGEEGHELGWQTKAQETGYLAEHPLDQIFIPAIVVYRNDDELRDWVEQVESQEVRVAENVAKVMAAADEGEKRHLLNIFFPMTRRACCYPLDCPMIPICFGGEDIRSNPLGSDRYAVRKINHPQEAGDAKS